MSRTMNFQIKRMGFFGKYLQVVKVDESWIAKGKCKDIKNNVWNLFECRYFRHWLFHERSPWCAFNQKRDANIHCSAQLWTQQYLARKHWCNWMTESWNLCHSVPRKKRCWCWCWCNVHFMLEFLIINSFEWHQDAVVKRLVWWHQLTLLGCHF